MQLTRNDKELVISINADDRKVLEELALDQLDSDESMVDYLTPLLDRENLHWISPEETRDLTSAPMVGELGPEEPGATGRLVGRWKDDCGVMKTWYCPIVRRWAFMDYQIVSVLSRLLDTGSVIFISGEK